MKSFVAYVLLITLVGGGLCARLRRQAPPEAAADSQSVSVENGPPADAAVTEVDGLQVAIDALEAEPEPDTIKIDKLKAIQAFLNQKKAIGAAAAAPPASDA